MKCRGSQGPQRLGKKKKSTYSTYITYLHRKYVELDKNVTVGKWGASKDIL